MGCCNGRPIRRRSSPAASSRATTRRSTRPVVAPRRRPGKLAHAAYALPGDKFTAYELNLFDVASQKQIKPEVDRVDLRRRRICAGTATAATSPTRKYDRGHQRFRLIEVDAHTGEARNLIDEKTKTFIWTAHTEGVN